MIPKLKDSTPLDTLVNVNTFIKDISVSRIVHFAGFFCTFVFCVGLEIICEHMKTDNKCAFFCIIAIRLLCAEQAHISLKTQDNNTQLGLNRL